MSIHESQVSPGALFMLGERDCVDSHISVLFPHWKGGHVVVTDVKETRLFRKTEIGNSAGTTTIVEFLFNGKVYSEGIFDFTKRAVLIN